MQRLFWNMLVTASFMVSAIFVGTVGTYSRTNEIGLLAYTLMIFIFWAAVAWNTTNKENRTKFLELYSISLLMMFAISIPTMVSLDLHVFIFACLAIATGNLLYLTPIRSIFTNQETVHGSEHKFLFAVFFCSPLVSLLYATELGPTPIRADGLFPIALVFLVWAYITRLVWEIPRFLDVKQIVVGNEGTRSRVRFLYRLRLFRIIVVISLAVLFLMWLLLDNSLIRTERSSAIFVFAFSMIPVFVFIIVLIVWIMTPSREKGIPFSFFVGSACGIFGILIDNPYKLLLLSVAVLFMSYLVAIWFTVLQRRDEQNLWVKVSIAKEQNKSRISTVRIDATRQSDEYVEDALDVNDLEVQHADAIKTLMIRLVNLSRFSRRPIKVLEQSNVSSGRSFIIRPDKVKFLDRVDFVVWSLVGVSFSTVALSLFYIFDLLRVDLLIVLGVFFSSVFPICQRLLQRKIEATITVSVWVATKAIVETHFIRFVEFAPPPYYFQHDRDLVQLLQKLRRTQIQGDRPLDVIPPPQYELRRSSWYWQLFGFFSNTRPNRDDSKELSEGADG